MTLKDALPHILRFEGGFSQNSNDPGGATNYGITQLTYNSYRKAKGLPQQTVKNISQTEVEAIYREYYWEPSKCDSLPAKVRLAHFDCAVNCGVVTAAKILQRAAGVKDDGVIGPKTIEALNNTPVDSVLLERVKYYRDICSVKRSDGKDLKVFLLGWLSRVLTLRTIQ